MKRLVSTLVVLTVSILSLSCSTDQEKLKLEKKETRITNLISAMTFEEKIDQLSGMGVTNNEFGDDVTRFGTKGNARLGIPDLIMGHGITGVRAGRDKNTHATYFNTPIAIGCTWDPDLYYELGAAMAKEMRALNQNLNLGPTLNIIRHPLGGRNWECFSEDPYLISKLIVPYTKAMQENGIICGPKHFMANNQEHNRFDINNIVDQRTLREIYLPAFKAAIMEGGALNIMGSYNRVNGTFMCENEYYLTNVLRDEWGFKGFVLSDFAYGTRSTHQSIRAGMNIEMNNKKYYGESLIAAVKSKEISEDRIDELLYEKLFAMFKVGMFDDNYPTFLKSIVHSSDHQEIALEVARKAPVLLKNEKAILPIKSTNVKSIAVIGPNAQRFPNYTPYEGDYAYYLQGGGSGRSYYFEESVISPYSGIKSAADKNIEIYYAQGCRSTYDRDNSNDSALISEAVKLAKKVDVVILVMGLNGFYESESRDREHAYFPGKQLELIKKIVIANPNVVLLTISGSYIDLSEIHDSIPAILFCPYSGEKIGQGIADILFGKINPEGKLPFSYPMFTSQYPKGSIYKGKPFSTSGNSNIYSEGIFVGYRHFEKENKKVLYPFGYGMSYTTFEYGDLILPENMSKDSLNIQFTIKNVGKMKGTEIVQMYIQDVEATVERPVKELKRFVKVNLNPGESKKINMCIEKSDLAFYDVERMKWNAESGEYKILIGASSADIKLKKSFNLIN